MDEACPLQNPASIREGSNRSFIMIHKHAQQISWEDQSTSLVATQLPLMADFTRVKVWL